MEELNYTASVRTHFDAAHFLSSHKGKCKNLHGHRWGVYVLIQTKEKINGMIVDFGDVKEIINEFDHQCLNDLIPKGMEPTCENIAEILHTKISAIIKQEAFKLKVRVYESLSCSVEVTR